MNEVFINIGKVLLELSKYNYAALFGIILIIYLVYLGVAFVVKMPKISELSILFKLRDLTTIFCKSAMAMFIIGCSNLVYANDSIVYKNTKVYLFSFICFLILSMLLRLAIREQESKIAKRS